MASFYAELRVAGHPYPVRHCSYEFTQATDARGRVVAKVRHGLVQLVLDVPDDDFLVDWANTPYKPLSGQVVFYDTKGGAARETLAWEAGNCVGYREDFRSGGLDEGAYVCFVHISAPKLTMQPGGPGRYVQPAAGEHGAPPQQALTNNLFRVPQLSPPPVSPAPGPVVSPLLGRIWAGVLRVLTGAPALTAALVLLPTNSKDDPGYKSEWDLSRRIQDQTRLAYLEKEREHRALSEAEEADLIALLGKVKGVHIKSLDDLNMSGPLRGDIVSLPGFHNVPLTYVKRTDADREALCRKFDSSARSNFLKKIGTDSSMVEQLKQAGFNDKQIERIASGKVPSRAWQVHHKFPLDDGGDNSFNNLMLIKNDPYHQTITNLQNSTVSGMEAGDVLEMQWPVYNGIVYPALKPTSN